MNNRAPSKPHQAQHILLFGASGASGLAFIKHHLSLPENPSKPHLTLYIRPSGLAKLLPLLPNAKQTSPSSSSSSSDHPAPRIRIVQGSLDDPTALRRAFSPNPTNTSPSSSAPPFPAITAVISLLGAYISPYYLVTRQTPTPLSTAFRSHIVPAMRAHGVTRVLVLSTPTAYPVAGEREHMSWGWYFHNLMPALVVPQGNAEMRGLAEAVTGPGAEGLHATVFRVPFLTGAEGGGEGEGEGERAAVVAGFLGPGFTEIKTLARRAMVVWLVEELETGVWIGRAPMLCDRV